MKTGLLLGFICGLILIITIDPKIYKIQTRSMVPELMPGDYILVSTFFDDPGQDELVTYFAGEAGEEYVMTKRVFAASGDTIRIDMHGLRSGKNTVPHDMIFLWLRGRVGSEEEQVLNYKAFLLESISRTEIIAMDPFVLSKESMIIIPPRHLFVTGDNYSESMDSRFKGFIHSDKVIGEIIAVF